MVKGVHSIAAGKSRRLAGWPHRIHSPETENWKLGWKALHAEPMVPPSGDTLIQTRELMGVISHLNHSTV